MGGKQTFTSVLIKHEKKVESTASRITRSDRADGRKIYSRISKIFREADGISASGHIVVTIEQDAVERKVTIPADLAMRPGKGGSQRPWKWRPPKRSKKHVGS